MSIEDSAKAAVSSLSHGDLAGVAVSLLVLLVVCVRYIVNINLKLIERSIKEQKEDIEKLKSDQCGLRVRDIERKISGIEGMSATAGLKVQELSKQLDSNRAVVDAYMNSTEKEVNRLENRLTRIEMAIKENHDDLSRELIKLSESVAVLISKAEK